MPLLLTFAPPMFCCVSGPPNPSDSIEEVMSLLLLWFEGKSSPIEAQVFGSWCAVGGALWDSVEALGGRALLEEELSLEVS